MSNRLRLVVLSVSTPVLAFALAGGFFGTATAGQDTYRHLRIFEDVVSLITSNYVEEVDLRTVMQGAMRGLADGLDPDTSHLSPTEVRALGAERPDADVGLALTRQYYLRVVSARDDSPAARAGLMTGDFIRGIDDRPTRDLSLYTGQRLLDGPTGSTVTLTVIRGSAAEPHVIELVREPRRPGVVTSRMVSPQVGYVRIPTFDDAVASRVETHIADLRRTGAERLVIDIRRTATGPLLAGIDVARLFVAQGMLSRRVARSETLETTEAQPADGTITMPVALLTSRGTAGAAEVFAAALIGNDRAETIGERTLGRTGEQKLVPLPDGSGLWMSWARRQGPGELDIDGVGLVPTLEVDEPTLEFGQAPPATDEALDAAIARLAPRAAA